MLLRYGVHGLRENCLRIRIGMYSEQGSVMCCSPGYCLSDPQSSRIPGSGLIVLDFRCGADRAIAVRVQKPLCSSTRGFDDHGLLPQAEPVRVSSAPGKSVSVLMETK